jgi:hypothetical protein
MEHVRRCSVFPDTDRNVKKVDSVIERIRVGLLAEPERFWWRCFVVAALLTRR